MSLSGDRIKECRLERNMTQEDVAKFLGIGKQAVYKYESGTVTNIPLDNVYAMSNLFRVNPCYLAGWSDIKNPSPIKQYYGQVEEDVKQRLIKTFERTPEPDDVNLILAYHAADPGTQAAVRKLLDIS